MRNINPLQQYIIDDGRIIFISPIYSVENKTHQLEKIAVFRHMRPQLVQEEMRRIQQIDAIIKSTAPSTAIGGLDSKYQDTNAAPFTTGGPAQRSNKKGGAFNFKSWKQLKNPRF